MQPPTLVDGVIEGTVERKKKRREFLVLAIKESPKTRSRSVAIPTTAPPFTIFLKSAVRITGCQKQVGNEFSKDEALNGVLFGKEIEMVTCAPNSAAVRTTLEEFPSREQRKQLLIPQHGVSPEAKDEMESWLSSEKLDTARGWSWFARFLAGTDRDHPRLKPARVSTRDLMTLKQAEQSTALVPIKRRDYPIIECKIADKFHLDQERRMEYIRSKKQPQISWFVQRIFEIYGSWDVPLTILDVGGGRGDLSKGLAEHFCAAKITVVDSNEPSLIAGRDRCVEFANRMEFVYQDFATFPRQHFDLVVVLHGCGGLSDRAIEYAVANQSAFLVCPCCYTKRKPGCTVHRLAELNEGPAEIPRRAQHVINSNRLDKINYCFTSLEEYDIAFSKRNMVLVGKTTTT